MGRFIKGDIVVINFPFSDLSGSKRRPALVLSDLDGDEIILCQITSSSKTDKYAITLEDEDFISGKLTAKSIVRPNKIFTADKNLILYVACKINKKKTDTVVKVLTDIINEQHENFRVGVRSLVIYNRKTLLLKRSTHTRDKACWESPGGRVEFGEDLHTALRREIKEETGLDNIHIEKLLYALTFVDTDIQEIGLMYLSYANSDKVTLSDEHTDFIWATKEQLKLLNKSNAQELEENAVFLDSLEID